jgi:FkbM family methyltransferase
VYKPDIDVTVSKTMLKEGGMWERPMNMLFQSLLLQARKMDPKFSPAVIDVGVNFGAFTLYAASLGSRVYGFDIQKPLLTLVDMSLRVNEYKYFVKLYHTAVWDRNNITFSFQPEKFNLGGTRAEVSSNTHYSKNNDSRENFQIKSSRIDDHLDLSQLHDIFFLKMDCEGCEPMALLGMDSVILRRAVQNIVIEIQGDPSMLEIFYKLGYECQIFDDKTDCLFPNLASHCTMPTYESAVNTFRTRRPYSHWNYYMDVHCYRVPLISITLSKIMPVNVMTEQLNVEGKMVQLQTPSFNSTEVYVVENSRRRFLSDIYELPTSSRNKIVKLSYGDFFLLPIDKS